MRFSRLAPLIFCAAFASCTTELTDPLAAPENGGFRLEGAISSSVINPGQSEDLTFRLQNLAEEPRTIEFPQSCQIYAYIETLAGRVVYPASGVYMCADVVTTLTLAPNAARVWLVPLFAEGMIPAIHSGVLLPEGRYRAFAVIESIGGIRLRSEYVSFEVR